MTFRDLGVEGLCQHLASAMDVESAMPLTPDLLAEFLPPSGLNRGIAEKVADRLP